MTLPKDILEKWNLRSADYAAIPRRTARLLQGIFFVPRYKIAMAKVHAHVLTHPVAERRALLKLLTIKLLLRALGMFTAGTWAYVEYYRIRKKLKDRKELIITLPGPLFEVEKLLGRDLLHTAIINLHIPWSLMIQAARNRDWRGREIYDNADPSDTKRVKLLSHFLTGSLGPVQAREMWTEEEYERPSWGAITYPFGFYGYIRKERMSREAMIAWKIRQAAQGLRRKLRQPHITAKGREQAIAGYRRQIEYWTDEALSGIDSIWSKALRLYAGEMEIPEVPLIQRVPKF